MIVNGEIEIFHDGEKIQDLKKLTEVFSRGEEVELRVGDEVIKKLQFPAVEGCQQSPHLL